MALAPCPECNHMVSLSAKACPRCGAPLPKPREYGCGTLVLVGLLACCVWIYCDPLDPRGVAPTPRPSIRVGDVVTLDDGDSMCALAADDEAWEEMIALQVAKGDLMPLVRAGRVFAAPQGSQAKVVEGGFASFRVQLLDGPFTGKLGWIQRECVRK